MALMLKTQRDGRLRDCWYGVYTEADGTRKVVNLNVKLKGSPHPSLRVGEKGDKDFEDSRKKAQEALEGYADEANHKGRAEHLVERLIESKTGTAPEYVAIAELPDRWLGITRDAPLSQGYTVACNSILGRFVTFMQTRNPKAVHLYQVKATDANAFADAVRNTMSPKTYREHLRLLRPAFDRFLPPGMANPFRALLKGKKVKKNESAGSVHRRPFTPEELQSLVAAASGDALMGGLITAAACTGMRRGDVCGLKWADVDLAGGMLTVKTSKTGAQVEIPIFAPLRAVLDAHKCNGSEYVFPNAAVMLRDNPDGLTWRFKKIVAKALDGRTPPALPEAIPAGDIEADGASAIAAHIPEGGRRARMFDTFHRYCAGESVRQIEKTTGRPRATVSTDLQAVENWIGKPFMRSGQAPGVKSAIARLTRTSREHGLRAASVLDWHALRTTFVTLALSAGVPLELVRRVTGHATVEVVLKHYFRPDREQFKAALNAAMPKVLTGRARRRRPADEHAALATKLAAGTATAKDKARMLKLAEKLCQ